MKAGTTSMPSKARDMRVRQHRSRNAEIIKAVLGGETLASAGKRHGISRERVRQIVAKHCMRTNWDAYLRTRHATLPLNARRANADSFPVEQTSK